MGKYNSPPTDVVWICFENDRIVEVLRRKHRADGWLEDFGPTDWKSKIVRVSLDGVHRWERWEISG